MNGHVDVPTINGGGLDGNELDPIVICGFALKFPQDATCPENLWKMLVEKRCAMTDVPPNRFNIDGFHDTKNRLNTVPARGGHFIEEDLSAFDAGFFSISPVEAASLDPMQRWLLEVAYHALENAGITMEACAGSSTGVYTGCFSNDYLIQLQRDPECLPTYAVTGVTLSMLANRLSWFFDFHGPSIGLDSACSSTAMSIDIACQALHTRSCNMAMIAGGSLTFAPEMYNMMSNLNFLSPDSRCYSFDHRANGYARGEGLGVIILKRLSDAIRDGNTIRAVIRATASNEDGRTAGITQPSRQAQEALIRQTYTRAGLSMAPTRFFEAHGTGTPLGDPAEAQAMGAVFRQSRSTADPLYVGAIKSNIGHLEGASSVASVIKAVLVLEKGLIPPNANFEEVNPSIDVASLNLKFPEKCHPWPTAGLRRVSINSFGYGGANCHIVLDDARNYMLLRSLDGKHCTTASIGGRTNGHVLDEITNEPRGPRLLVLSSADQGGIGRLVDSLSNYVTGSSGADDDFLDKLVNTYGNHRSHLLWRSYALLQSSSELQDLKSRISTPVQRQSTLPRIGFVFTGQGAQWYAMGRELMCYDKFKASIESAGTYLNSIGCPWSAREELLKSSETSRIDDTELSQTLCTVLQVALVDLLRAFNIRPSAVVGHSSGEIAAAYAGGYISAESAWRLAYFRGICSAELASLSSVQQRQGAMISVGLSEDEANGAIQTLNQKASSFGINVACVNSPGNVTVSGEEPLIDQLKEQLDVQKVFSRKLRVSLAYHSSQMEKISAKYVEAIGSLSKPQQTDQVPMVSSVTSKQVSPKQLLDPCYWSLNMVSPVQFSSAISTICTNREVTFAVDHLLEIGPHAALAGPIRDILKISSRGNSIQYTSILRRGHPATETALAAVGELYSIGLPLNFSAVNEPFGQTKASRSILVDLPSYPFDHSQKYWHEGRLSRNYRLREHAPSEFLGVRCNDWDPNTGARWRHFLRTNEIPWVEDHAINGRTLFPAAGMLVMVIEAARQLSGNSNPIDGFALQDVVFESPIPLTDSSQGTEVQTCLRRMSEESQQGSTYQFTIQTYTSTGDWIVNCRGEISVDLVDDSDEWAQEKTQIQRASLLDPFKGILTTGNRVDWQHMYSFLRQYGYQYGTSFQLLRNQCHDNQKSAADITVFGENEAVHVIHPATLDALFQLSFTALSSGGSDHMATSIPTRVASMWLSNSGLSRRDGDTIRAYVANSKVTSRGFLSSGVATSATDVEGIKLWYEGLELTNVTEASTPTPSSGDRPLFCMEAQSKIALGKLDNQQIASMLEGLHTGGQDMAPFFQDLENLVDLSLHHTTSYFDYDGNLEPHMKRYQAWAKHHLAERRKGMDPKKFEQLARSTPQELEEFADRLKSVNYTGRLFATVALNLVDMLTGKTDPLDLLIRSDILDDLYDELDDYPCGKRMGTYLNLLAHEKPGMNVLEVGGGTGGGTGKFIKALCARPGDPHGFLRCNRYDFTDVSPAFFDTARDKFKQFRSQMSFAALDIAQPFEEQGFKDAEYDVVLAAAVLHIAPDIRETLLRIRKSMKPGGKLIAQEFFEDSGWIIGFCFGLLPGWWLGAESGRPLSPNVTVKTWDTLLRSSGFSGIDINLEFGRDVYYHHGWFIATAIETVPSIIPQPDWTAQAVIVINEKSPEQNELASRLVTTIEGILGPKPLVQSLEVAVTSKRESSDDFIVLLADYGSSFLETIEEATWRNLQSLIQGSNHLLWVSSGGGSQPKPGYAMIDGLARTIRTENNKLHLVTLELDDSKPAHTHVPHIEKIVREMASTATYQSYEEEYIERDGFLHTRRLVEAEHFRSTIESQMETHETVQKSLSASTQFLLSASPGNDSYFKDTSAIPQQELAEDAVDLEVKAFTLQAEDRTAALESDESSTFSRYASGIVQNAGVKSGYKPGDRVFVCSMPAASSHLRVSSQTVVKISLDLQFGDACWAFPQMIAAYHSLIEVACVRDDDSVLILGGATPIGQAALRLLARRGMQTVWATAADKNENSVITKMGVLSERILPRLWFERRPMAASPAVKGFDKVLLVDQGPRAPMAESYIRPGGKLVVLRTDSLSTKENQASTTHSAPANVSISYVDMSQVQPTRESLEYATASASEEVPIFTSNHVSRVPASQITEAFDQLKKLKDQEMIVVELDDADTIDVLVEKVPKYRLRPDATYLIAGGLGGLGRGIARWLVSRGARNLILLSRRGPKTPVAFSLLEELRSEGAHVEAPCCNLSDEGALKSLLEAYSRSLPPIMGCIQAGMVIDESLFEDISFKDWKASVDAKVRGSWNLHKLLPQNLDFFILLSSVMGILGSSSLASYNAGNTFQDALAHHRVSFGLKAVSIDLGAVSDGGYVAESEYLRDVFFKRNKHLIPLTVEKVLVLLDIFCDPTYSSSSGRVTCQPIVGISPPAHWKQKDEVGFTMSQPFWGHMHYLPSHSHDEGKEANGEVVLKDIAKHALETVRRLTETESLEKAAEFASEAVSTRVSSLLGIEKHLLDPQKALGTLGVDSLSAIELRNWISRVFDVEITVFEIFGIATSADVGREIARKVQQNSK
ncbi:putative polyketide synthase [Hypomontagnella monticulosa]|nr:putative polyketide synthase [Hypomontagnella monticulosa]